MKTPIAALAFLFLSLGAQAATLSCSTANVDGWQAKIKADVADADMLRDVLVTYLENDGHDSSTVKVARVEADPKYRPTQFKGYKRFLLKGDNIVIPGDFARRSSFDGRLNLAAANDAPGTSMNLRCVIK